MLCAPEIKQKIGANFVSNRTIQRRLCDAGLFGRRAAKKPFLKSVHVKARLLFAQKHVDLTVDDWKKFLWSDESKFNMVCNDGPGYVRRPIGKRFHPKYTQGTIKHGGGNIMVWGCFSFAGIGPLYRVNGKMDQVQYREILTNHMLPFARQNMPRGWQFQHDNDPKHTANSVKKWIAKNKVKVLSWPAMSPDLNPIENLWNEVERSMKGQKHHNPNILFESVQQAWVSLPKKLLENLVESMPRRCQAIIDAKGYATKY